MENQTFGNQGLQEIAIYLGFVVPKSKNLKPLNIVSHSV